MSVSASSTKGHGIEDLWRPSQRVAAIFLGNLQGVRDVPDDRAAQCFSRRRQLNYEWLE
jgi:hypothetical protein